MRLEEVPSDMVAVRCIYCDAHLAVPVGITEADRIQLVKDHRSLCPALPAPCPCRRCGDER